MTKYTDIKLEITESEQKLIKRYYQDSKKRLKRMKKTGNFQSLKESDLKIICSIETFGHIFFILEKAKNQYKELLSEEIENKFLTDVFITLAIQEHGYKKKTGNKNDFLINEHARKLSEWFKFFTFAYSKLTSLYAEFDIERPSMFRNKVEDILNEYKKKFSSMEIKEKNFLFSLIIVEVINFQKKKGEKEKLEAFNSLLDSSFMNFVVLAPQDADSK